MQDPKVALQKEIQQKQLRAAETVTNKKRQLLCANAEVKTVLTKEDPEKLIFLYETSVSGCKNQRRHGSKWCQGCSDAHKTAAHAGN